MGRISKEAEAALHELIGGVPAIPPIQELLDARVEHVEAGDAVVSMEAGEQHHNVINVVHGGILTSLAELAASVAIMTELEEDEAFTFIDQTTNYERPVVEGQVRAQARVVRKGRRIGLLEVLLADAGDREVARARFTALVQQIERA